jgi:hypothetical protein
VSQCSLEREEVTEREKGGAGLLGSIGLELERPQARRSFGEKFQRPGGAIGRGKRGKRRGDCGLLIGAAWGRNGRGINQIEEGSNSLRGNVSGEKSGPRRKKECPGRRATQVSEREGGERYPFGICFLGRGLDLELGQIVSPRAFYIFILFSSLSFLFFLFLSQILQKALNQFKPLSENFTEFTARF